MSARFWTSLTTTTALVLMLQTARAEVGEAELPPMPTIGDLGYELDDLTINGPVLVAAADPSAAQQPAPAEAQSASAKGWTSDVVPCQRCGPSACCCSKKKKEALKKAVAGAHKGLFYDNDFSYLYDDCYDGHYLGDGLKRNRLGDNIMLDVGGQFRLRLHREKNHRGLGLTGRDDDFLLYRTRLYTNIEVGERLRFYYEYLDAVSNYEQFAPRPIEENRSDVLNLFADILLFDQNDWSLAGRVGRQELFYGAQRAVSPLDWANTRRTFDGAKLMYSGENWDADAFWVKPLARDFRNFDETIDDQAFYGIYSTYKAAENFDTVELYWLAFDNDRTGFRADSVGTRVAGSNDCWLYEVWGNYQFGTNADNSDHEAGAFTLGLGRKFDQHPWKPTVWLYYDWASGGDVQGAGNGYFQFFPLAHKYLGLIDLYARNNIEDINATLTMQLAPRVKLLLWYHAFYLQDQGDTPYNVNSTPFAPGVTPGDDELGQELDVVLTLGIDPRSAVLFGFSHFWSGDYYNTPGLPVNDVDADFFYVQYHYNF